VAGRHGAGVWAVILARERLLIRQRACPAAVPKHASENGAYTLQAMSLTYFRNSAKLEPTD